MIDFNNSSVFKLSPSNMADLAPELTPLLVPGEELLATFKGLRDSVAFTNKRLIALNVQGITGKEAGLHLTALFEGSGVLRRDGRDP